MTWQLETWLPEEYAIKLDSYLAGAIVTTLAGALASGLWLLVKTVRTLRIQRDEARTATEESASTGADLARRLRTTQPFELQDADPIDICDFVVSNSDKLLQGIASNAKLIDMTKTWIPNTGYYSDGQLAWRARERLASYVMKVLLGLRFLDPVDTNAGTARLTDNGRRALEQMARNVPEEQAPPHPTQT